MMLHIIFFFYIILLAISTGVTILLLLLAKIHNNKIFLYSGYIFLGTLLNILTEIFLLHKILSYGYRFTLLYSIIYYTLTPLAIFLSIPYLPLIAHRITKTGINPLQSILYVSFLILTLLTLPIEYFINHELMAVTCDIIYGIIIFYSIFIIIRNFNRISGVVFKKYLKVIGLTIIFLYPPIVIYNLVIFLLFKNNSLLHQHYLNCILYLVIVLLILRFVTKYYFRLGSYSYITIPNSYIERYKLSKREYQIIQLLIEGFNNKKIADKLFISPKTVKNHIYHIYKKMNIKNRLELLNTLIENHNTE